jgi:hypothetical protein
MDITRVAFFHGLESQPRSQKNVVLDSEFDFVYAPSMNYHDPALFESVLADVLKNKVDLLIGSSMGGWFAYCISTITGIPTLLFNPGLHSRSIDPVVRTGDMAASHTIILGNDDDIIVPRKSIDWLFEKGVGCAVHYEKMGHRIPIDVFERWVKQVKSI